MRSHSDVLRTQGTRVPSPLILRITFDSEPERLILALAVVRILRASLSAIGNPGMKVPYIPLSGASFVYNEPFCETDRSKSTYVGVSDVTGVSETRGGAALD